MVVHIPFHSSGDLAEAKKRPFFSFHLGNLFFIEEGGGKKKTKRIGHLCARV